MATSHMNEPSFGELVQDLRDEATGLLRQEVALAKAEMSEKVAAISRSIALAVIGGAVAHLALIFLLLAASGAVNLGVSRTEFAEHRDWIAPLVIGLMVGAVGACLALKAKSVLANMSFAPEKTIASVKEDARWVQNKVA